VRKFTVAARDLASLSERDRAALLAELRRWAREHLAIDAVHGKPAGGERYMEF
jgi:hypothetical protein